MPCSARNAANKPCGISTKNKYCHVHARKMIKEEKDEKMAYKIKQQKNELRRLFESNQEMKKKLLEVESKNLDLTKKVVRLEDDVDMLSSMKEDYETYQLIKNYELLFSKMSSIYKKDTALEITKAMKEDPSKCFDDLGYQPWKRFNKLRLQRNAAAHLLD